MEEIKNQGKLHDQFMSSSHMNLVHSHFAGAPGSFHFPMTGPYYGPDGQAQLRLKFPSLHTLQQDLQAT